MDKKRAKFILQSFRPDGADSADVDFAEALKLATEDRELASWLAEERAQDAVFAEALTSINIPHGLREEVLAVMQFDGKISSENSELDGVFTGALADVMPPDGLRDQILAAMEIEQGKPEVVDAAVFPAKKWLTWSAIAALLMLGVFVSIPYIQSDPQARSVAMHQVQLQSGAIINASSEMQLDFSEHSLQSVNAWLENENLPAASTIPQGLIESDIQGGRKLVLDNGVEVSLLFFKKEKLGDVYLMVLKSEDVENIDSLKQISEMNLKRCKNCPIHHFKVMMWKDGNKAYMMLSNVEETKLIELF